MSRTSVIVALNWLVSLSAKQRGFRVSATADTIWRVPAYLPYLQPPPSVDVIALAEKEIGYRLPEEYLDLIRKQNGGYIRYKLPESPHDTIAGIGPYFPSLTRFDWKEIQGHVSYCLEGLVPFDGDGHWYLCLDYRNNAEMPRITFVDIECDKESNVADSFVDYLDRLQLNVGGEFVHEP
ncbi:MAG: SMI1/KNR4 family protein [Gemmataceae bacterium]